MSKFQAIVLGIFVTCIVAGVIAFATFKSAGSGTTLAPITVWGTFPAEVFSKYISDVNSGSAEVLSVKYVQESPDQFGPDFISALAKGTGPDAVLIPADMILPHVDKFALIPYSIIPQRTYMDTFIQEAGIYITQNGIVALPFTVDPLIMYWNRDMFNAAGIATYPKYWDEFTGLNQKLTVRDGSGNIKKTAIAMGDFSNETNAREMFGTLLMQLGNPVTTTGSTGVVSAISFSSSAVPSSVFQFFTQFVDPSSPNYSWNRGMPNDKTAFLSGISATYFGFASELKDIRAKNPNLNFDAAPLPQVRNGGIKAAYGKMFGFSLVKNSANPTNTYSVISSLLSSGSISNLSKTMYLPPVRRDLIAAGTEDPYLSIFDQAALIGSTWLDADPLQSKKLFATAVQSITSGKSSILEAIQNFEDQYNVLLKRATQ